MFLCTHVNHSCWQHQIWILQKFFQRCKAGEFNWLWKLRLEEIKLVNGGDIESQWKNMDLSPRLNLHYKPLWFPKSECEVLCINKSINISNSDDKRVFFTCLKSQNLTLVHAQMETGKVISTRRNERETRIQPQTPIPSRLSAIKKKKKKEQGMQILKRVIQGM